MLFKIDDRPYKAALDEAKANVEYAKAALVEAQANYEIGIDGPQGRTRRPSASRK